MRILLVFLACAVVAAEQASLQRNVDVFMNWLRLNGAYIGNITVVPASNGYGVIATSSLVAGEKFVEIPLHIAMNPVHIDPSSLVGQVCKDLTQREPSTWSPYACLLVQLVYEACHNNHSAWAPYFALLPTTFDGKWAGERLL